jgi:transposase InsO family protein
VTFFDDARDQVRRNLAIKQRHRLAVFVTFDPLGAPLLPSSPPAQYAAKDINGVQLNGKVERSHRTDKEEFYQLLTYRDDVDLEKKLATWEGFYNYDRPHGAHSGKTPYEVLREKLR